MHMGQEDYAQLPRDALVAALAPYASTDVQWHNWSKTFHARPLALFRPPDLHHTRLALELSRRDARVLRPLGEGHSPSDIACTRDYMLDVRALSRVLSVHPTAPTPYVHAEAGILLSDLHPVLASHGLAMRNLGSISDQTLAGIVATATHGSGVDFGVMGTHVLGLTLLKPDNTLVECSKEENRELFEATVEKVFLLRDVHTVRPFEEVVKSLDTIKSSAQHVRLWWFPTVGKVKCMLADRVVESSKPPPPKPQQNPLIAWFFDIFLGYHTIQFLLFLTRFAGPIQPSPRRAFTLHPGRIVQTVMKYVLEKYLAVHALPARLALWLGGAGRKQDAEREVVIVDESVKVFNVECRYPQHTTEYALPSARAKACIAELGEWLEGEMGRWEGERPHFPIEIRFSKADDLWLSPSNGEETCWIGIVVFKPYALPARYRTLFRAFERILEAHGGRPHWAKAHRLDAREVRRLYPMFGRFLRVVREVDPEGTFRNEYIERHLFHDRSRADGVQSDGREYKAFRGSVSFASSSPSSPFSSSPASESSQENASWWGRKQQQKLAQRQAEQERDWRVPPSEEEVRRAREVRRGRAWWGDQDDEAFEEEDREHEHDSDSEKTLADPESRRSFSPLHEQEEKLKAFQPPVMSFIKASADWDQ
ncbi:FAD-binding PCMH-type domain-containing protein [Favolaschia claudopus]|uniref:D-arabinono-1,4-lactone oxidase n=1 Tax=Favolaschia claudopus TaxID=2862362 RepID=A0AAW0DT70_9AGAR